MRRPTAFSAHLNPIRTGSAVAFVLATILSCSDSMSPTADANGVTHVKVDIVDIVIPDSVKQGLGIESSATRMVPVGASMSALSSSASYTAAATAAPSCGGGGAFQGYTKSRVAFLPEAIPNFAPDSVNDDGIILDTRLDAKVAFNF